MADTKISALTGATTPLAGTEILPIVQGGSTKQVSVASLTAGRAVGSAGGTFTDNYVQGTAGKGVNFNANTPAAGMTSQLLNWYEEGTWTPMVSAISGAYTTVSVAQGSYTRIGRQVTLRFNFTVSNKGTGANGFVISGLPFTANGGSYSGSGFNASNVTGTVLYGVSMSTQFEGYLYDGTDPVVVNQSQVGVITYFV